MSVTDDESMRRLAFERVEIVIVQHTLRGCVPWRICTLAGEVLLSNEAEQF